MEKQKYVLSFTVICKDGSRIHETATTYEEDGLVNAENNVAWRYVVKDNPKAKYAGGIIRFDSGREIDGSKRSNKKPLYLLLKEDLLANGIVISIERAKKLRTQFHITNKNYSDVVNKIVNFVKGEENMGNIEKAAEAEVKVESANVEINKEEKEMEVKTLYAGIDLTDKKTVRKISNQVLSMIIDKKTNEEKHLFSKVFNILYDSGAYMDICKEEDKIMVLFGDSGVNITTKSAIDFSREVYIEVQDPEWVDAKNAAAIRARLTDLFKPAPAKQETTGTPNVKPVENKVVPANDKQKEERNMTVEDFYANAANAAAITPDRFNKNTAILVEVKAVNKEDKSISDVKVGLNIRLWQDKENENFFRGKLFTPKGVEIGKVFWDIQKPYLPMLKKTGEAKYGTYMYKCSNELNVDFTDPNALAAWNRNQMILAVAKAFNQFGIHAKNTSGRTANVTTCYKEIPAVQTTSSIAATPPVQGNPWAAYIK